MNQKNRADFFTLLGGVHAFYRQELSDFAGNIWWQAMQPFDYQAVVDALNRHCVNPDTGQFMPKPADVVRMLQGGTSDQAAMAWAKVDRAVRTVGTWQDVAFDDALIHRCVAELGGWVWLGQQDNDEWPFVAKRFETLYRGYRMRSETPAYQPVLIGIANAQNCSEGKLPNPPILIGDPTIARKVLAGGSTTPLLATTRASSELMMTIAQDAAA